MHHRDRLKTWLGSAGLFLAAIAVGALALEGGLRLTHYRYLTHPTSGYPTGYYREVPELGVDLTPDYPPTPFVFRGPSFETFTNGLGCFDHDGPITRGYVLAIGDSSTWGYIALEERWTTHLERLSGRRVLNCGVSGTGPRYQRLKAEKTIAQLGVDPALIIVLYDTWNDLNDDVVFPGYAVVQGQRVHDMRSLELQTGRITRYTRAELERKYQRYLIKQRSWPVWLQQHSALAATLELALSGEIERDRPVAELRWRYQFYLWHLDPAAYPWLEQALLDHLENIRALRRLAESHGAELVLIANGIPDHSLHRRLRDALARELPHFHDVAPAIEQAAAGSRIRYHHDHHWNALGNRLAAEAIHRHLTEANLLQPEK